MMDNIKKTKEEIKKEYNKNCEKINELENGVKIIRANDFEDKALFVFVFSMLPWALTTIAMMPITVSGIIPISLIQPLSVFIPVLIGISTEELFSRKCKLKEHLKSVTKSKTSKERLEEVLRFQIKIEELENQNIVLNDIYDRLVIEESQINSLANKYNISVKYDTVMNLENIDTKMKELNENLLKKQKELSILSTKNVLRETFWRTRDKFQQFSYNLMYFMLVGLASMAVYNIPVFLSQMTSVRFYSSIFECLVGLFVPFIAGTIVSGGYQFMIQKRQKEVFNKINQELGKDAISEFNFYGEDEIFDTELEKMVNEIVIIKLELETQKRIKESLMLKNVDNLEKKYEISQIRQKTTQENVDLRRTLPLKKVLKR